MFVANIKIQKPLKHQRRLGLAYLMNKSQTVTAQRIDVDVDEIPST